MEPATAANFFSTSHAPELSVVIPFYNEAPNVNRVLKELRHTLETIGVRHEVLAIDDGSQDDTKSQIDTVAQEWAAMRVECFERNRGQAAALLHGFERASGRWIAMLDGDGQNPPGELEKLWRLRESADMVAGVRFNRQDSWLRRSMSWIANKVRRVALRDHVSDTGCSLKIFRRELIRSFIPIRTMYSFLPAFAVAGGWRVCEVPVAHRPREAGVSKYGLRAMVLFPLLDLCALCWLLRRMAPRKP